MRPMPDDGAERVADALCEATLALEDVDLNLLSNSEVRAVLAAEDTLREICRRYRQNPAIRRHGCSIDDGEHS